MPLNLPKHGHRFPAAVLIAATALFAGVLYYIRRNGIIDIDDAYITFRYAENIAAGLGFVYNKGEHVLGSTTPLFCLMLAFFRMLGVSAFLAADLINLVSAGLSAMLVYAIVRDCKVWGVAFMSAFLFALFPHFWMNLATGMETMFTMFLCLLAVWLDLRKKPVLFGIAAGLLVLTRLDALALVAAILLLRLLRNPGLAFVSLMTMLVMLAPWGIFSHFYFGSLIPHSILAKKLIHVLRGRMVLSSFGNWFFGLEKRDGQLTVIYPVMIVLVFFALLGSLRAIWKERWAVVFMLWIVFYIAGLTVSHASPFFWYKIPMLAGYIILASLGIDWLFGWFWGNSKVATVLKMVACIILVIAMFKQYPIEDFEIFTAKEQASSKLAQVIKNKSKPGARILAGEIGVIGYELPDDYIIDSAGLVSDQVYKIRLADREELVKTNPNYKWDWWGTRNWVDKTIAYYKPDFIVSDVRYLYLSQLISDPEFNLHWDVIASQSPDDQFILALKRR